MEGDGAVVAEGSDIRARVERLESGQVWWGRDSETRMMAVPPLSLTVGLRV